MTISGLIQRYGQSLRQFIQFGFVGGLGVLVNQAVFTVAAIVMRETSGILPESASGIGVRYQFFYAVLSFLVANLFNFVLNRHWTFQGSRAPFLREYLPFLAVGSVAQVVGLAIMWLLTTPVSPLNLPDSIFDNSTGLRTKSYWANLIQIFLVMPINFVVNKLWTFRAIRNKYQDSSGA